MVKGDHGNSDENCVSPQQTATTSSIRNQINTNEIQFPKPNKHTVLSGSYLWFKLYKLNKYHTDDELYKSEHLVISSADIPQHLQNVPVIKHFEVAQVIVETENKLCLSEIDLVHSPISPMATDSSHAMNNWNSFCLLYPDQKTRFHYIEEITTPPFGDLSSCELMMLANYSEYKSASDSFIIDSLSTAMGKVSINDDWDILPDLHQWPVTPSPTSHSQQDNKRPSAFLDIVAPSMSRPELRNYLNNNGCKLDQSVQNLIIPTWGDRKLFALDGSVSTQNTAKLIQSDLMVQNPDVQAVMYVPRPLQSSLATRERARASEDRAGE